MIELLLEKYCDNCPRFEADQETVYLYCEIYGKTANHYIRCKHHQECSTIKKYLESK